nr:cytochrome c oxidase subunit 5b-1, mitochondrial-like [Ipomoea trifida]
MYSNLIPWPLILEGLEANVPYQPNPPTLENGEKETLSDASPNLELKDGDIALEGDKDLSKNLVPSETLSPHEATVGKRNKKAPKRARVGKLIGVKLGVLQKTSNGTKGFKESLFSPITIKGASSKEDSWIGYETVVSKKRVEDVMPIATGHEREELEAELQGKKILDIDFPEGPFGTKEAPAVVKSYYDKRIVGCPGGEGEDEHDVVWFWLEKGKPHECPVCSQYFVIRGFDFLSSSDGNEAV